MAKFKKKVENKAQTVTAPKNSDIETDALNAFISKMNEKAIDLGMKNTAFKTPTGAISQQARDLTTTEDIVRLMVNASSYPEIARIWNKKSRTINIYGRNPRKINIKSSFQNPEIENEYYLIGGKTAFFQTPSLNTANISALSLVEDKIIVASIANAYDLTSAWVSLKELLDISKNVLNNIPPEDPSVIKTAECATACILPQYQATFTKIPINFIFSQNGSKILNMLDITKVMTVITALDWVRNIHDEIKFMTSDTDINSDNLFAPDDVISIEDAMIACLLASSNQSARALSRYFGEFMLRKNPHRLIF